MLQAVVSVHKTLVVNKNNVHVLLQCSSV